MPVDLESFISDSCNNTVKKFGLCGIFGSTLWTTFIITVVVLLLIIILVEIEDINIFKTWFYLFGSSFIIMFIHDGIKKTPVKIGGSNIMESITGVSGQINGFGPDRPIIPPPSSELELL